MIAITFALPAESSGLVSKLESKRASRANNLGILFGQIAGREVALSHTGVGRERCHTNIELFLDAVNPQVLVSSGFAGSLTPDLTVGDLIIAGNFSDAQLVTRLMIHGNDRTRIVKLVTLDRMLDSSEDRALIAQQESAAAVDMETDVVAQACAIRAISMVSLRVISDSPAAPFPAPPQVLFDLARQKTNFVELIGYVVAHPSTIVRLRRFAGQISHARTILTDALVEVIRNGRLGFDGQPVG